SVYGQGHEKVPRDGRLGFRSLPGRQTRRRGVHENLLSLPQSGQSARPCLHALRTMRTTRQKSDMCRPTRRRWFGSSFAERRTDRNAFLLHFAQEEAVMRKTFRLIALLASVIAAGLPTAWLFATKGAAQSPQTQARGVPVFEVDPAWPKL